MTDNNTQQNGIDGQALVEEYSAYRRIGASLILVALLILIVSTVIGAWLSPISSESISLTDNAITEQYQQTEPLATIGTDE
ncbi:MAG: hypothetical protein WBC91_25995 [Phototrophicaceae bacterium]